MNTLQVLGNQVLGVFVFLVLSRYLDKDVYGELNWALAVLTLGTTVLSLRLEQIVVRDVAAGKDASALLTLFIFHTVGAALLFGLGLAMGRIVLPVFFARHFLLLWLAFSQLLLFIALPFRQLVTGRAEWGWLAALSLISNFVRSLGLVGLVFFSAMTVRMVVVLFTVSALAEWLLGAFIVFGRLRVRIDGGQRFGNYVGLIKDSLPQVGLVFLNAGMARIDWVLMGLFSTPAHTAEYSFAYRAYEFSPLPLLVLAPFLLNSFSRRYVNGVFTPPAWLGKYKRAAIVFGTVLPLIGVVVWSPLMDWLTAGKYGSSNWLSFLILSCSVPFQYLINIHWTEDFACNRLRRIFFITAVTAVVVVGGDVLLIPVWAGNGAAAAWLAGMVVQYLLYRGWLDRVVEWLRGAKIDWALLFFLVGVLNVKLYVKVAAILFAMALNRKRPFRRNRQQRYWWFYAAMLLLAGVNLVFSFSSLSVPGFIAFGLGCGYWLLCLLAAYYIYLFVADGDVERLHRTVRLFFLLNGFAMLASFVVICIQSGSINPYTYEGEHRRYFINTGDMITGLTLDGSVTTALIGAFGVLYFFHRNRNVETLFCLATLLLAGSNFTDMMLLAVLVFVFIFRSSRIQKSMVVVMLLIVAVFFAKVSPQNGRYVESVMRRVDGHHVYEEPMPIPNARENEFVERKEVLRKEATMRSFEQALYPPKMEDSFRTTYKDYNRSGRWVAMQQMVRFFGHHPALIPLGAGMGRFSSRLAYKTTALNIVGSYPIGRRYIAPAFRDNYLYLYLYYHGRDEGQHSVVNKPDSVYGQLLCEYGLVGLLLFGTFYVVYFIKRSRSLSYGLPLLLLMGMAFFTEYWFEQLSVVVLFEFLLLLDRRANNFLLRPKNAYPS